MLYKWGLVALFILPGLDLNSESFTEELINYISFRNRKTAQGSFLLSFSCLVPTSWGKADFGPGGYTSWRKRS